MCPSASAHLWGRLVPRPGAGAAAQMPLEIRVLGPLVKPGDEQRHTWSLLQDVSEPWNGWCVLEI